MVAWVCLAIQPTLPSCATSSCASSRQKMTPWPAAIASSRSCSSDGGRRPPATMAAALPPVATSNSWWLVQRYEWEVPLQMELVTCPSKWWQICYRQLCPLLYVCSLRFHRHVYKPQTRAFPNAECRHRTVAVGNRSINIGMSGFGAASHLNVAGRRTERQGVQLTGRNASFTVY
jgi:hypothetical protein